MLQTAPSPRGTAPNPITPDGIADVLNGVGVAVYEWDLASDAIDWSANAADILEIGDIAAIATGSGLAAFLDRGKESRPLPRDVIMGSASAGADKGAAYRAVHAFVPVKGWKPRRLWLEDSGRWYADAAGRPARAHGTLRVINERHEEERRLAYLSRHDEATGQMNRAALVEALDAVLTAARRRKASAAFMIAAIDNLALINSAYGFDVADDVIKEVGIRLRRHMRAADSLGRFSGNKFGMVLASCRDGDLDTASRRLRAAIRDEAVQTSAGPVAVTISLGAVQLPRHAQGAQRAMLLAQEALDQAKSGHRDTYAAYTPSQGIESARRLNIKIADSIISALNEGRVHLSFQPIVSSHGTEPVFYESLLRMTGPDGKAISASNFIPATEKLGLARLVDHRVLELALQALAARPDVTLAINISASTASDRMWREHLHARASACPGIAERLIIEITETVAIHDLEESRRFIHDVKELGCRVAIDDFGAGYTSFRNLKMLDIDMVKIDGAFVENLSMEPDNQVFVRTLIELTRNFNIETVAEWVTCEEDAALLVGWGADYLQGYLFGEPSRDIPRREQPEAALRFG